MSKDVGSASAIRRNLFSEDELDLLTRLAAQRGLLLKEITELIDLERRMEHMGRRRGIHQQIESAIERIAQRRLQGTSS